MLLRFSRSVELIMILRPSEVTTLVLHQPPSDGQHVGPPAPTGLTILGVLMRIMTTVMVMVMMMIGDIRVKVTVMNEIPPRAVEVPKKS